MKEQIDINMFNNLYYMGECQLFSSIFLLSFSFFLYSMNLDFSDYRFKINSIPKDY